MRVPISDVWRLDGTIDRRPYFALGVALSALKMVLDYLVATRLFGREWSPLAYAVPSQVVGLFTRTPDDRVFVPAMLLMAAPLVLCGVALTVRRLRSARLPVWAVVLFFAPIPANLIFYLVLSLLPARPARPEDVFLFDDEWQPIRPGAKKGVLDRAIPHGRPGGALVVFSWGGVDASPCDSA